MHASTTALHAPDSHFSRWDAPGFTSRRQPPSDTLLSMRTVNRSRGASSCATPFRLVHLDISPFLVAGSRTVPTSGRISKRDDYCTMEWTGLRIYGTMDYVWRIGRGSR